MLEQGFLHVPGQQGFIKVPDHRDHGLGKELFAHGQSLESGTRNRDAESPFGVPDILLPCDARDTPAASDIKLACV